MRPAGGVDGDPIALGRGLPVLSVVAGGRIWVVVNTGRRHSLLWQVDPATGTVAGRPLPLRAGWLPLIGFGSRRALWLADNDRSDGRLVRFSIAAATR